MEQAILDKAKETIEQKTAALKPRTEIPATDQTQPCSLLRVAAIQRAIESLDGVTDPTLLGVVVTYVLHQPKSGPIMRMTGEQIVDAACEMADEHTIEEISDMSDHALKRWDAYAAAQQISSEGGKGEDGGPEGNLPSSDG